MDNISLALLVIGAMFAAYGVHVDELSIMDAIVVIVVLFFLCKLGS